MNNQNIRPAWSETPWYAIDTNCGGYYIANTADGQPGTFIVGPEQGTLTIEDATRIVECVNAMAGIENPLNYMGENIKVGINESLEPLLDIQPDPNCKYCAGTGVIENRIYRGNGNGEFLNKEYSTQRNHCPYCKANSNK